MSKRNQGIVAAAALAMTFASVAAVALFAFDGGDASAYRGSIPPGKIDLPDFTLPDYAGGSISSRELRGKVVLITFLDSQCTESCPIIASQIAGVVERLEPEDRAGLVAIAISTDPDEDTAAAVRDFLHKNRADKTLRYLVAPVERMRPVWDSFAISASFDTGMDTLHSAPVRIYDREGVWASTLHAGADLTEENLAFDIRLALRS